MAKIHERIGKRIGRGERREGEEWEEVKSSYWVKREEGVRGGGGKEGEGGGEDKEEDGVVGDRKW